MTKAFIAMLLFIAPATAQESSRHACNPSGSCVIIHEPLTPPAQPQPQPVPPQAIVRPAPVFPQQNLHGPRQGNRP